jgi:hypothetical protein
MNIERKSVSQRVPCCHGHTEFVCEEFIFPQNQGSLGDNAFLYQKS